MARITERKCLLCNRNYENDRKIVLNNHMCTTCILKGNIDAEKLLKKADEIYDEINEFLGGKLDGCN